MPQGWAIRLRTILGDMLYRYDSIPQSMISTVAQMGRVPPYFDLWWATKSSFDAFNADWYFLSHTSCTLRLSLFRCRARAFKR